MFVYCARSMQTRRSTGGVADVKYKRRMDQIPILPRNRVCIKCGS